MLFFAFIAILLLQTQDGRCREYAQNVHLNSAHAPRTQQSSAMNYILIIVNPDCPADPQCRGQFGDVKFPIHKVVTPPPECSREKCSELFNDGVSNLVKWAQHTRGMNTVSITVSNVHIDEKKQSNNEEYAQKNKNSLKKRRVHNRYRFRNRRAIDVITDNPDVNYDFSLESDETPDSPDSEEESLDDDYVELTSSKTKFHDVMRFPVTKPSKTTINLDNMEGYSSFPIEILPHSQSMIPQNVTTRHGLELAMTTKAYRPFKLYRPYLIKPNTPRYSTYPTKSVGILRKIPETSKDGLALFELIPPEQVTDNPRLSIGLKPKINERRDFLDEVDDEDLNSSTQLLPYRTTGSRFKTEKTTKLYLQAKTNFDDFDEPPSIYGAKKSGKHTTETTEKDISDQEMTEMSSTQSVQPGAEISEFIISPYTELPSYDLEVNTLKDSPSHHPSNRNLSPRLDSDVAPVDPGSFLNALKQQFYHSFLTAMETDQANTSPSLLSMVQNLLGQMESIQAAHGYFALIHGGSVSDLKNCSSDLVHTLHFIWNVCDPGQTVIILTADCSNDVCQLPLLVSGPDTDLFNEVCDLLDVSALIREHIQKHESSKCSNTEDTCSSSNSEHMEMKSAKSSSDYRSERKVSKGRQQEKIGQLFESFPNGDQFGRELAESLVAPSDIWYSDIKIDAELDKMTVDDEEVEDSDEHGKHNLIKRSESQGYKTEIGYVCGVSVILILILLS